MEHSRLTQLAFERARLAAPLVTFAIVATVIASEPSGIPLTGPILVVNAITFSIGLALTFVTRRRPRAARFGHAIAAAVWLLGPINTITSMIATRNAGLNAPILLEITIAPILQIETGWFAITTATVGTTWLAFDVAQPGGLSIQGRSVVGALIVAFVVHALLHRLLIRAETSAAELARALEQVRHEREQFVRAQRLEAVGTLAAGLAHDLNNILAGVLGLAEGIREGDSSDVRADAAALIAEAQRGAGLTRSLLAFGQQGQYQRRPTPIRAIVDDVRLLMTRTASRQIAIVVDGTCEFHVDVDRAQITQALVNVCANAADAMGERGGTLAIATALAGPDGVISVTDTGHGIEPRIRDQIFEPFFTTKPPGQGSGLGLAMVWGCVHGHGGSVEVESEVGIGSTFRIVLPTVAAPAPIPAPVPPPAPIAIAPAHRLVLVVDDEPLIRRAVARILKRMGCEAITASDGAEAVEVFASRSADIELVVLDMSMPVMAGPECFRAMREIRTVPIVIVSGYTLEEHTRELLALGSASFIEKPFEPPVLAAEVARWLDAKSN